jgi:TolB-like protein
MPRAVESSVAGLSDRERDVASKFSQGMTYREIGKCLFIAPTTVRTHISTIYRKLGVHSKLALAALVRDEAGPARQRQQRATSPVIAVIPIENLSGDERWNRLADGLSADITADLARYSDLAVVARQTMRLYKGRRHDLPSVAEEINADFILEGTLQAVGQRVRIAVQLIDASNRCAVWTGRYDRQVDDLFAMQDSVTENVVNILATRCGKIAGLGCAVARRKPPANLGAYDCYMLGVEACHRLTHEANCEAIRLHSRAVELDPGLARAWTALGMAHAVEFLNDYSGDAAKSIERWQACLEKAMALDPGDSIARLSLGELRAIQGDLNGCAEQNELAMAMAPDDADTLAKLAGSLALIAGNPHKGYALARRAIRLNPYTPWYYSMLGRCCFVVSRYREALAAFEHIPKDCPATLLFVGMAHAMLGQMQEATRATGRMNDDFPSFKVGTFIARYPVTNPLALDAIEKGSRRANLA